MNTTGEYQKNIPDMEFMTDTKYENIFKVYLKNDKYIYNILKTVHIDVDSLPNASFDMYKTPVEMPWTILSHNVYGTMDIWWLIYITNKDTFNSPLQLIPGGTLIRLLKMNRIRDIIDQVSLELEPPS